MHVFTFIFKRLIDILIILTIVRFFLKKRPKKKIQRCEKDLGRERVKFFSVSDLKNYISELFYL